MTLLVLQNLFSQLSGKQSVLVRLFSYTVKRQSEIHMQQSQITDMKKNQSNYALTSTYVLISINLLFFERYD